MFIVHSVLLITSLFLYISYNCCTVLIRFAEPDSEDNIMFDQKELRNTNIKGGTLLKLVERLTFHKYASEYMPTRVTS